MNSYFYVDSIPKMLAAKPDNAVTAKEWCHKITSFFDFPFLLKWYHKKWLHHKKDLPQQK